MTHYDTILVGATAFALGYAHRAEAEGRHCAVIEAGCICMPEFSAAWSGEAYMPQHRYSDETEPFVREIEQRGICREKQPAYPEMGPLAAKWFDHTGCDAWFLSRVTEVSREADVWKLTVSTIGGSFSITSNHLLDTTPDFDLHWFFGEPAPKGTLALTVATEDRFDVLPVPNGFSMAEARASVWEHYPRKILAFAPALSFTTAEEPRSVWYPSNTAGSVADAIELGLHLNAFSTPVPCRGEVQEETTDIVVVGLGTAGSMAAIRGARSGLRVLGIEQLGISGGTNTAGAIQGYYAGVKGGLYQQIDQRASEIGDKLVSCHVAYSKSIALQEAFSQANVIAKYDARVCQVLTQGQRVVGLLYRDAEGLHRVRTKMVIDATADGMVCRLAGCEMLPGRESDDGFMTFSNTCQYYDRTRKRMWWDNRDNGILNQYDPIQMGHQLLHSSWEDNQLPPVPDSSKRYLGIAPLIGIRQGQRILGEEVLTFSDFLQGRLTQQPIFWCRTNLDTHNKEFALENRLLRDWFTIGGMWGWNVGVPVGVGTLIPKGWGGILAAGRCLSCDHNFSQGVRMMDDCSKSGEAAGALATLSIELGEVPQKVPYELLKAKLEETGCIKTGDCLRIERQGKEPLRLRADSFSELWLEEWEIAEQLGTNCPGYAIWSVKIRGSRCIPMLKTALSSSDLRLCRHAALALSLLDDASGEDILLDLAMDRSGCAPNTSYMYVMPYAVSAISALGRLGSRKAIPALMEILEDPFHRFEAQWNRLITNEEDAAFQFASHAVSALAEIEAKHPGCVPMEQIRTLLSQQDFPDSVTMMGTSKRWNFRDALAKLIRADEKDRSYLHSSQKLDQK